MNKFVTFGMLLLALVIYLPEVKAATDSDAEQLGASCTSWDIRDLCCPSYCAAKNSSRWSSADNIFAGCIASLQCKPNHTSGFLACGTCKK